uniref:Uncharacterized protein n=1 Tax=Angiostrongylus cantonensis TaxID=6313 RepID=A0A0K0CT48_ANGCA
MYERPKLLGIVPVKFGWASKRTVTRCPLFDSHIIKDNEKGHPLLFLSFISYIHQIICYPLSNPFNSGYFVLAALRPRGWHVISTARNSSAAALNKIHLE